MNLYEPIGQDSLIDEINRLCNTTNQSYQNVKKIANINEALNEYWHLAVKSANKGTFDDTGRTSAPVETQNLVSGTNAYKVSDFTNAVLGITSIAVLDSDGIEHTLDYEEFATIDDFIENYDTAETGVPSVWTKFGDYIYLASTPNYNSTGGLKAYVDRELSKFSYTTFTVTIATPGVATATSHGLVDSDAILLITDGALPTGLTPDSTIYYVDQQTANTWQFCTTPSNVGSTYITTSGTQSGTHKFIKVNKAPGIPSVHHKFLARFAALEFMDSKHPKFQKIFTQLEMDKKKIQEYWESYNYQSSTVITPSERRYK